MNVRDRKLGYRKKVTVRLTFTPNVRVYRVRERFMVRVRVRIGVRVRVKG